MTNAIRVSPWLLVKSDPMASSPKDRLMLKQGYGEAIQSLHDSGGSNTRTPVGVIPDSRVPGVHCHFEIHRLPSGRYVALLVCEREEEKWIQGLFVAAALESLKYPEKWTSVDSVELLEVPESHDMFRLNPAQDPAKQDPFGGGSFEPFGEPFGGRP